MSDLVKPNPWTELRRFTRARIALGRSGAGLPTAPLLEFGLAHAQARDAVHAALDSAALHDGLRALGLAAVEVHSAAADRTDYLKRPDLGRQLGSAGIDTLRTLDQHSGELAVVVADGLSATADQSPRAATDRGLAAEARRACASPRSCSPARPGWRWATRSARSSARSW